MTTIESGVAFVVIESTMNHPLQLAP